MDETEENYGEIVKEWGEINKLRDKIVEAKIKGFSNTRLVFEKEELNILINSLEKNL